MSVQFCQTGEVTALRHSTVTFSELFGWWG